MNHLPLWMAFLCTIVAFLLGGVFTFACIWLASHFVPTVKPGMMPPMPKIPSHLPPPAPPFTPEELDDPAGAPVIDDFEDQPLAGSDWGLPPIEVDTTVPRPDESERIKA